MRDELELKIKEWAEANFRVHTDWTGSYIEFNQKTNDIDAVVESLMKHLTNL